MENSMLSQIKVGTRIKFKACTRWSNAKQVRVVNGFHRNLPTIRFGGWSDFVVRENEIISIIQ
jgi:hypothetical protein